MQDHASEPTEGRATRKHETASAFERRTSPFLNVCKASPPKVGRGQCIRLGKRRIDAAKPLAPRKGLGVANAANGLKPLAALGKRPKVVACCGQRGSARLLLLTEGRQGVRQTTKSRCLLWAARERSPASADRREAPGPARGWLLFNSAAMSEAKSRALNSEKDRRPPSPRGG